MSLRVCATPGCPTLVKAGARGGRCAEHERARDRARGTTTQRGYGTDHQRLRASYQARMARGERFTCWRCEGPIDPSNWHLGHDDRDRSRYRGPECPACNLATSTRRP